VSDRSNGHDFTNDKRMNGLDRMGRTVLVLGGAGMVGRAIVDRLRETGFETRIFSRSAPDNAGTVRGDIQDLRALEAAMAGIRTVVNAVGILRETPNQTFHGVHVVGVQNAVLAARNTGVDRFIHVTGVNQDLSLHEPLSQSKALAEEVVWNSRLDFASLRAPMLFGTTSGAVERIRWTLSVTPPFVVVPGDGKGRFQPLWVEDLAECVRLCISTDLGIGTTHDLAGPDVWSYRQLIELLEEDIGVRRIKISVPLSIIAGVASVAAVLRQKEPWVTMTELRQLGADNVVPIGELERTFGIVPLPLRDWLARHKDNDPPR